MFTVEIDFLCYCASLHYCCERVVFYLIGIKSGASILATFLKLKRCRGNAESRRTSKLSLVYFTFFPLNTGLSWGRGGEMSSGEIHSEDCPCCRESQGTVRASPAVRGTRLESLRPAG